MTKTNPRFQQVVTYDSDQNSADLMVISDSINTIADQASSRPLRIAVQIGTAEWISNNITDDIRSKMSAYVTKKIELTTVNDTINLPPPSIFFLSQPEAEYVASDRDTVVTPQWLVDQSVTVLEQLQAAGIYLAARSEVFQENSEGTQTPVWKAYFTFVCTGILPVRDSVMNLWVMG
jgi:hypothetical protein